MTFTQLGIDSFIHKVCDSSSNEKFKTCVFVFQFFLLFFFCSSASLFLPMNPELDRGFKPIYSHLPQIDKIDSNENAPNAAIKMIGRKEKCQPCLLNAIISPSKTAVLVI